MQNMAQRSGLWDEALDRPANLGAVLQRAAEQNPDGTFATFIDSGASMTFGELNELANRFANGLAEHGVSAGDFVAIMLNNVPEMLVAQYGAYKAGVVAAVINADFQGPALARLIALSQAKYLITSPIFTATLEAIWNDLDDKPVIAVIGGTTDAARVSFQDLLSTNASPPEVAVRPTDTASVLFTSGTTGPSKGCLLSHWFAVTSAATTVRALRLTSDDCVYTPYPLHHYAASYNDVLPAMLVGARVAVRGRFSASALWDDLRRVGGTVIELLGSVAKIIEDAPARPDDADNPLRVAWGGPLPADENSFCRRFGLQILGAYGSTDVNNVTYRSAPEGEPPSVGHPLPYFDLRVADDEGNPVPAGAAGELLVRGNEPGLLCSGYLGMDRATVEVWRDLWYHTGDLVRFDDEGRMWYLGRKRESLRRAGENVSTFEVEEGLHLHPAVQEAAVIGVPSTMGEQLIKAYILTRPGAVLTAEELKAHGHRHLARFMVPDIFEFLDELPRTSTGKVAKGILEQLSAEQGVAPSQR